MRSWNSIATRCIHWNSWCSHCWGKILLIHTIRFPWGRSHKGYWRYLLTKGYYYRSVCHLVLRQVISRISWISSQLSTRLWSLFGWQPCEWVHPTRVSLQLQWATTEAAWEWYPLSSGEGRMGSALCQVPWTPFGEQWDREGTEGWCRV